MKKTAWILSAAALVAAAVAGCAALPAGGSGTSTASLDQATQRMLLTGFHDHGIAKMDRITNIDDAVKACNEADIAGKPLDAATAKRIEEENFRTIKWPSDGKFLGDWKSGEQIAQSGRGQTWSDNAATPSGGNCYNCHQITKQEISFGTLGPSLYNYGKLRGVTDPNSPAAKPVVEYTWGKIWNAKAYNACSNMPRSGHMGNLNQQQVRDLMALLLDPRSPVNQ
jgi:L-cysteine S-thiosulfotransferase